MAAWPVKKSLFRVTGTTRWLISRITARSPQCGEKLRWDNGYHAEFVSPPVVSSLLLANGRSVSHHQTLHDTLSSIARFSPKDAEAWRQTHDKFHMLIRDCLITYYYHSPISDSDFDKKLGSKPHGQEFSRLWRMTPDQLVDELFESDAVKTLVLSQMAIPRGVAMDYPGGAIEVLKLIAGDEKPELARGGCPFHRPSAAARLRSCRRSNPRRASRR